VDAARWLIAGLLTVSLAFGVGCTSHKTSSRRALPGARTTLPPNGAPTAAALAAVEKVAIDLTGANCGGGPLDAGYPTTTVGSPTTCLRDADRTGKQAFMSFTGRTGSGGAYRLVYAGDGRGALRINAVLAGPTGALHREGWACRVPREPLTLGVLLGFPGRVVPSLIWGNRRCRHLAS
jgi:hypothetical protein